MLELELYENLLFGDEELPAYVSTTHCTRCREMYNPNWHEQLELIYIVEGQANIRLDQDALLQR